ncbi:hypothetical protein TRVL_04337 [Trypanosoma vivax]|uniref:Uncharacterized protein n=1 Tax=Trypanosoma vivax (strain Y486) TaxID=1055687 RepID=G0U4U8_TRYVY|nr:hypothetical protein TRVL_04337 [Trypanosoma vivax]CCC52463.1 hypothetical protein TVY486_1015050 [Trypanosoma vivax Y486]
MLACTECASAVSHRATFNIESFSAGCFNAKTSSCSLLEGRVKPSTSDTANKCFTDTRKPQGNLKPPVLDTTQAKLSPTRSVRHESCGTLRKKEKTVSTDFMGSAGRSCGAFYSSLNQKCFHNMLVRMRKSSH